MALHDTGQGIRAAVAEGPPHHEEHARTRNGDEHHAGKSHDGGLTQSDHPKSIKSPALAHGLPLSRWNEWGVSRNHRRRGTTSVSGCTPNGSSCAAATSK